MKLQAWDVLIHFLSECTKPTLPISGESGNQRGNERLKTRRGGERLC